MLWIDFRGAGQENIIRLELLPQEAFGNPLAVYSGKKMRIVVRSLQMNISD